MKKKFREKRVRICVCLFFIPEKKSEHFQIQKNKTQQIKNQIKPKYKRIAYEVVLQSFGYSNIVSRKNYLIKVNVKISIEL